jgi:hypothetical protein
MTAFFPRHDDKKTWWRRWSAAWAGQLLEAARLGCGNVEYLALGAPAPAARAGRSRPGKIDSLLRQRIVALGLDPYELALSDPALLDHLDVQCSFCESRERCARDLACGSTTQVGRAPPDWRDYCENVGVLEMLEALRSRSQATRKYQFPYLG